MLAALLIRPDSLYQHKAGEHDQYGGGPEALVRKRHIHIVWGQTITPSICLNPWPALTFSHKIR